MNKPLVYLDMDGVISDFAHEYYKIEPLIDTVKKFHTMVMEHKIFEKLGKMPNADKLLNLLFDELDVTVCILSSLGTHTFEVAEEGRKQKQKWLRDNMIHCEQRFVYSWAYKKLHAIPTSIMIDDRHDVITTFKEAGGLGVQYIAEEWDLMESRIREAVEKAKQREVEVANIHI
jgi:5'(3')-deoxyribonucleotidase